MYQLQFDHTHRIASHSPVVEVTRSTATLVSEQGGQFQRMLSHTARGGENADTDAPGATESRRRPIPTLQLETLKEAQSRQAARVSQELEGGGQRAAPPAIDIRETAEFLEGGFGGRRGAQPSRYPQTMESQDEPRAPHPDDDTVVVDEPEEGPPHAVATSDALSHNISAVTYENNATPRDWNHPGSDRSEVAFPLVSAIDPTQLAHLHSRLTSGSDGDGDLSALEEFPTLSPMVDTPTLRAPSPQFPVSGGALRAGLVANTHIGGDLSVAVSPETVPSAQHPGSAKQRPNLRVATDTNSAIEQRDSAFSEHRHYDLRLSHLPQLELYAPMVMAMEQRLREEVSRAVAAEKASFALPPPQTSTTAEDYEHLKLQMAAELYNLKRHIQQLAKVGMQQAMHQPPPSPSTAFQFPPRSAKEPLRRSSSARESPHRHSSVQPLRESKLGLSQSIDVSLRRSFNQNRVSQRSPSPNGTPRRKEKKRIVVKVVKGYDSPPVPYTKQRKPAPTSPPTPTPNTPARQTGLSKRPASDFSPASPIRGKLRRSSASDLRHSIESSAVPNRSYSQSTFIEESIDSD